jgi:hypothetical protein
MSRKITVTKEQIIKAIQTETQLVSGTIINSYIGMSPTLDDFNKKHDSGDQNCGVCAVGAVLRNYLPSVFSIYEAHDTAYSLGDLLYEDGPCKGNGRNKFARKLEDGENPLAVLSQYFEFTYDQSARRCNYYDKKAIERTRRMTCAFVRDCFPE